MSETDVLHAELRAMREDVSEIKSAVAKVSDAIERLAMAFSAYTAWCSTT